MKALFVLSITLISASFSKATVTLEDAMLKHRDNLKLFLDWSHKFSAVYEQQRINYIKELNASDSTTIVKSAASYPEMLSTFLYAATKVRNALVKEDNDHVISDQLPDNARLGVIFLCNMSFVLDDLRNRLVEWGRNTDSLRHTGCVKDRNSLQWFKEHGFEESSLNDITIPELEVVLQDFYFNEKPFYELLAYFGNAHNETCSSDIGSKLAWLSKFGESFTARRLLAMHYTKKGSKVDIETVISIMEQLTLLGYEDGPLGRVFGNGRDGGLYPFIMPMLDKTVFYEERGDQYIRILLDICSTIEEDLRMLIVALKDMPREGQMGFYRDLGFFYNTDKPDAKKLVSLIEPLIADDGTITKLVKFVKKSQGVDELRKENSYSRWNFQEILYVSGMVAMGVQPVPRSLFLPDGGSSL